MDFISFPGPEKVIQFVHRLNEADTAKWGIMTPQHMLEHLILPLQFSRGVFSVPLVTPVEKVEKVKRIMLLSDAPLKKDFAAPFISKGLQTLIYNSFEAAQKALIGEIELFLDFMEKNPNSVFTHPIFGALSREEWFLFHRKHFTHHFAQFGITE